MLRRVELQSLLLVVGLKEKTKKAKVFVVARGSAFCVASGVEERRRLGDFLSAKTSFVGQKTQR